MIQTTTPGRQRTTWRVRRISSRNSKRISVQSLQARTCPLLSRTNVKHRLPPLNRKLSKLILSHQLGESWAATNLEDLHVDFNQRRSLVLPMNLGNFSSSSSGKARR